ncbi:GAF and ANTAR domain-containing protein [Streptomyces longispororuber]|uniref:GAF and ANTAR domain-containing protein n=1 Tax=Streptomyces longispororuber TaxID=68230 RepID=UPI0033D9EBB5
MDHDHHAAAWQRISAAVLDSGFSLATACVACADDVDADFAGATLVTAGELRLLAAATDEHARLVEDVQLVTGEGPCTDAFVHNAPAEAADLHHATTRWPAFAPLAGEHGARAVLALPLTVDTTPIGAMDLYRRRPVPFTAAQKDRADAYAGILALLALDEYPHLPVPGRSAPHGSPGRPGPQGYPPTVHLAAGVLAEKYGLSPEDALARLRAHSFRHDRPLLRTARHVLDHHSLD